LDNSVAGIVMGLAEQKYPGKPWKYLLLDHHHIDHIGGLRAFAAAGATIVVGKGDGAFYRKVLSAPETLNPYGTKQVPPKVEEVDGRWSATEGGRTIEAYSLDNPHSTGYIIPYIPDAKLGFVTDIWSPAPQIPPANPGTTALVKGVPEDGHPDGPHGGRPWRRRQFRRSGQGGAVVKRGGERLGGRPRRSLPWCHAWPLSFAKPDLRHRVGWPPLRTQGPSRCLVPF
jgi:hypothetical protein